MSDAAPSASISAASLWPDLGGLVQRAGGGPAYGRAPPSGESATARIHSSSPSSPSATSARAPTGAVQPASRSASTARSAATAARVRGSSSAARTASHQVGVGGAALDRERTLAGGGQHLQRVEHLGHLVEPAEPGQAGAGQHDRVELAGRAPCRSGCPRCRGSPTTSRPRPSACSCAARRGEPVPTRAPAGSSPRVSPSRATTTSRGSSRSGTAASAIPSAGRWAGP